MTNENDAKAAQSSAGTHGGLDVEQALPPFPERGAGDAPSQYRMIQQAQEAQEATLAGLQAELQAHAEKLAQLNPAPEGVAARAPRLDVISMRLAELERKLGEGASDPVLDEIARRLAVLEGDLAREQASGPRIDELAQHVEKLKKRLAEPPPTDPRTEDAVLRIASLEASLRQVAQSAEIELLNARIEQIQGEIEARQAEFEEAAAAEARRLESLSEAQASQARGLEAVEQTVAGLASSRATEDLAQRLRALEERPAEPALDSRVEPLAERVETLESVPALDERLAAVAQRVANLESIAASRQGDPGPAELLARLEEIERRTGDLAQDGLSAIREELAAAAGERLAAVEQQLALHETAIEEAATLSGRVSAVEALNVKTSSARGIEEILGRLETIESGTGWIADGRIESLQSKVASLESQIAALAGGDGVEVQAIPDDIAARIEEIEARLAAGQPDDEANQELAGRLAALEQSARGASGSEAVLREIGNRLDELERKAAPLDEQSEHWSHWARNTLEEIERLRQTVDRLEQERPVEPGPALGEAPAALVESLGAAIAGTFNKAEVRALRSQMYFVYFSVGMLWILMLFFGLRS